MDVRLDTFVCQNAPTRESCVTVVIAPHEEEVHQQVIPLKCILSPTYDPVTVVRLVYGAAELSWTMRVGIELPRRYSEHRHAR